MPRCDCSFDFVKALIKGRPLQSYTLIPQRRYRATIRKEHAIVTEKNAKKKHQMIADASSRVGSLTQCPRCGSWLFVEPKAQAGFVMLRRTNKTAKQPARRKPTVAGSRR